MVKTVLTIIGAVFLLVGIAGFAVPNLLGAHLSPTHNVIHLVSGALSLYLGLKGSDSAAVTFSIVFGAVYLLLGIVGFLIGGTTQLFKVIPNTLELGLMDHLIHLAIGGIYLIVGVLSRVKATA